MFYLRFGGGGFLAPAMSVDPGAGRGGGLPSLLIKMFPFSKCVCVFILFFVFYTLLSLYFKMSCVFLFQTVFNVRCLQKLRNNTSLSLTHT